MLKTTDAWLPNVLRRYWAAMVVMALVCAAIHAAEVHFARRTQWVHGGDFTIFAARFRFFRQPEFWAFADYPFTYPAPLAVVFAGFYALRHGLRDYTLLCAAGLAVWSAWLALALRRRGVRLGAASGFAVTVLVTSWPVYLLLDSGNIEGLVWLVLTAGTAAVLARRFWLGTALIGVAGAMKIFPLVLLGLVLSQRRYREFGFGLLVAVLVTCGSLKVVGPTMVEAQRGINTGLTMLRDGNLVPGTPTIVNHSLWGLMKWAVVETDRSLYPVSANGIAARNEQERALLAKLLTAYLAATALLGLVLYFWRIQHLPILNQAIALTVCAVLLPPLSIDYTLVHLLLPFGLLCLLAAERSCVTGLNACLICFAVIFSADTFLRVPEELGCQARTIALVILLVVSMRHRFVWPRLDAPARYQEAA